MHQTSLSHTQSKQNSKKSGFFVFFDIFCTENERAGSEKHDRKASAIARLANFRKPMEKLADLKKYVLTFWREQEYFPFTYIIYHKLTLANQSSWHDFFPVLKRFDLYLAFSNDFDKGRMASKREV